MFELNALRAKLSAEQRTILNVIWRYLRENKRWIPAVSLYKNFGGEAVDSILVPLGGTVG